MSRTVLILVCVAWLMVMAAGPARAQSSGEFAEKFSVITQKNIFLKDRRRPMDYRSTTRPTTQASRRPVDSMLLTGTVLEDNRLVAFVENTARNTTDRVLVGQSIGGGKVVEVRFGYIGFELDGQVRQVELGQSLGGGAPSSSQASASGDASATSTPIDPNDPNAAILERLRQRRLQETRR